MSDPKDFAATRPTDPTATGGPCVVVLGSGAVRQVPLPERGELRIGRGEGCEIHIEGESVSRRHAVLRVGPPMTIEDLGSSNGTRVAGVALPANVPTPVAGGDVITIGEVTLLLQLPRRPGGNAVRIAGADSIADAEVMRRIATSDINVLVCGETGVGKEVMAKRLHELSARAHGPLVAINCGAVPDTLLESELFGHEAGAFTGASTAKPGLLESAAGGTVFLDEVGELPPAAQVKLLRVLEDRRLVRVGGVTPRNLDVRFVAATHRDLRADVAAGRFREDLYYRLSGITLAIPPLRERLGELPMLLEGFVAQAAARSGRAVPSIAPATVARLRAHEWPGNIRELRNVVDRAMVLCGGDVLLPEHVVLDAALSPPRAHGDDDERSRILAALAACAGNQTRAAERLGIARKTLGLRMDALGIPRPQKSR
ncbi:MAG: sigma 54-interacting transcriptional regulator [Nannocystaceae bacterium]